jgi:hypothetical protein
MNDESALFEPVVIKPSQISVVRPRPYAARLLFAVVLGSAFASISNAAIARSSVDPTCAAIATAVVRSPSTSS